METKNLLLKKNSEIVPLAPKAGEVLLALVEARGELITRHEILEKVWADTFIEEANLTHYISALRKALGEEKTGRKYIETIPRKGYRFIAEISCIPIPETAEIVFKERNSIQITEETSIESNHLVTDSASVALPVTGTNPILRPKKSIIKQRAWLFLTIAGSILLLLCAGTFWGLSSWRTNNKFLTVSMPGVVFRGLTPEADSYAPSISPDGLSIAFARREKNQETLWRKLIATGQMTQLLPAAPTRDGRIFLTRFSPDGRWIYYKKALEADGRRHIFRIPANGGESQKILSNVETDFSISPDGTKIAFLRDWRQVVVADIETGAERIIFEGDGLKKAVNSLINSSVAWSPDGTRLVYFGWVYQYFRKVPQLTEFDLTTGTEKQISLQNPPSSLGSPAQIEYLPDGSGLIGTVGGQIWFGSFQTGEAIRISNQNDNFNSIRLSADGKTIIAEKSSSNYNLWTAPVDNLEQKRQITSGATAQRGVNGLSFAPNGKIIYSSLESGADDLWEIEADGNNRRQLTNNAGRNNEPRVTPDGRYIVFKSHRSGSMQIWRMDAGGGNPVQLSKGIENWVFAVSPENEVYYLTLLPDGQQYQLYKVPVTGGEPVEVNDRYYELAPDFSPDGKWILTWGTKTRDEPLQLSIIERATGNLLRNIEGNTEKSRWSLNSKSIYYVNQSNGQLFQLPIDGGEAKQITNFDPLSIASFDFSADGKSIVFSLGETTSEIISVQNFSEKAK